MNEEKAKKLAELLWNRGPREEILRLAREIARDGMDSDPVGALIALASVYYSLAKRLPLGPWDLRQAVVAVNNAYRLDKEKFRNLSANQIDIVTTIWGRWPGWRKENLRKAYELLSEVLFGEKQAEMVPHTRALLLITMARVARKLGHRGTEEGCYSHVRELLLQIESEGGDRDHRERQLCRVLFAVGFYYFDSGVKYMKRSEREWGEVVVRQAYKLARRLSPDQERKILKKAKWRGIKL